MGQKEFGDAKRHQSGIEHGQLVVLMAPRTSSKPPIYQWRTSDTVVDGPLEDWLAAMAIPNRAAESPAAYDPMMAALNRLAAEGWTLLQFQETQPGELAYDRELTANHLVTARWWLARGRHGPPEQAAKLVPAPKSARRVSKSAAKRSNVKR